MRATIRLVMITALRDRLFGGLFGLLIISTALAMFLGGTAINEQREMALVFAAGGGRLMLILGLVVFAAFHIQALFETREVEAILSRSISRLKFVLAYWIGFACLSTVLAGVFGFGIALLAGATPGAFVWAATLIAECWVVLGVVLFAGLILERATPTVLFVLGFYSLARLMGFFVGIRETATDESIIPLAKHVLDGVLLLVPRLDLFAQSRWILYGANQGNALFLVGQTVLFLALVLLAAVFDLKRKEF